MNIFYISVRKHCILYSSQKNDKQRFILTEKKSNLENSNVVMSIVWLSMVKILIYKNVDKFSRICTSKNKCTVVKWK